jgi:hypothetical protein
MMGRPIVFHCTAGAGGIAVADRATNRWIVQWIVRFKGTMTDSRPVRIRRTNSKPLQNKNGRASVRPFCFSAMTARAALQPAH